MKQTTLSLLYDQRSKLRAEEVGKGRRGKGRRGKGVRGRGGGGRG